MKRISILLLMLMGVGYSYAQQLVVKDKSSLQPIANVHITAASQNLVTNNLGKVDISSLKNAE